MTQSELARAFDLPLERVRVIAEPLGGAFGGKFALVEPLAAGAALALKRPVRLVLTRSEDFQATNPASAQVTHLKIGARADGTLTGIEARMIVDRGSNAGWGVEGITSLLVAGPYNWEAHDLRGYGVQTNRFTFGAYRAPGAPTAAFALESLLDDLANALELDPIQLRLKNAVVEGDVGISGNPFPVIGAREVLERISEHPLWASRDSLPGERRDRHGRRPLARGSRACGGCLPRRCRRHDDGRDLGSGHEWSELGLLGHRGRRFRSLARERACRLGRHELWPVRRRERRLEGDLHGRSRGLARGRVRAREGARSRVPGARDRARRPRGRGRRRARRRRSRPLDHGRGDRKESLAFRRASTSRSKATAARRRRAARPPSRPTSRTFASIARRARSSSSTT